MKSIFDLQREAFVINEEIYEERSALQTQAWRGFGSVQHWYRSEARELASERATLITRAATMEAADNVRAREREANRNVVEAVAKRRLEDKYARTFETQQNATLMHMPANHCDNKCERPKMSS